MSGATRVFLYNLPAYLATWGAACVVFCFVPFVSTGVAYVAAVLASSALLWSVTSLLISSYIYDRSELARGAWLVRLLERAPRSWATVHAGLDDEIDVDSMFPGSCVGRLDIFDGEYMTAPSIARARKRTQRVHEAVACRATALSLTDETCDLIVVSFAAHEIRDARAREKFFEELRRVARPGGRIILIEHLRDFMNFVAFGPGFLHFLSRREWLRLSAHARLSIAGEIRVTPWVMALALEKTK